MRIISKKETASKCGGVHPTTPLRWANDPRFQHLGFPQPIQISDGRMGWVEAEVDKWLASRPRCSAGEVA